MNLNFFTLKFDFDNYQILYEPYNENRLNELRKEFNATHSFFRNGDNIFISNKDGDEHALTGSLKKVSLLGEDKITDSLIKHLFFRTFKDRFPKYVPIDFYPFRFFSKQIKDDIIYKILPDELKGIISYKKLIEIQLRRFTLNENTQFGFVINIRRNWVFNKSCEELNKEGFNLIGTEVLRTETLPGLDNVLAPNEEFIGIINSIDDNTAHVQTNEGEIQIDLNELTPKKNKANIGKYLSFKTSEEKSNEVLNLIESKRNEIYNAQKMHREIQNIANLLFVDSKSNEPVLFQNKDGFCFTVEKNPLDFVNSMNLQPPTFIYDYAGTKTKTNYPDLGLNDFGPYDSVNFDTKSPSILCICHKDNRGTFASFLANLFDGLPQSKYFKKGFRKKYDLHEINFSIEEITSYSFQEYNSVIRKERDTKPDLAIIEIPAEFRKLDDDQNPYYQIKAKLLALEVPVQLITSYRVKEHNEYILNSIGLQLYAKMGGTPWVLPSNRSVDRELVIGIGHSWIRNNSFKGADQNRVVGITTFMSSDGQYLLGDKVKDVSYEEYFNELLKSLSNSFNHLRLEQGWSEGDTVRLIFHIFKPIKNIEFDVISSLIGEFDIFKIQFAFVTIGKNHPFKMFDKHQRGIPTHYQSSQMKGTFIPNRATNLFLDSNTCLVQMLGAKELKMHSHGMSNPVQIKIRTPQGNYDNSEIEKLLFTDLNYIVQQIFSFTYLSWRSFLPGERPATMLYSDLISKILGKMRNVQGWDPDSLNYKLKRKKWFL